MSGFDRVIEMVNAQNAPTYPLSPVTIKLEDVVVDASQTHNTRVTMKAQPQSGYTGQVDLYYTRANLTALGVLELVQEPSFTYDSMLGLLNSLKSSQLTQSDLTNSGLPVMETGVVYTFTLSARSDSLAWLGNTQISLLTGIPDEAASLSAFLNNDAGALFA